MTEANNSQTTAKQQGEKNRKIINKMASMVINMDLVTNPIEAVEKWRGVLDPDKDTLLRDFADIAAGNETDRTEAAKKLASYTKDIYTNNLFQYKEAMQIMGGLQLKTKDIAQIIVPYYFVSNDLEPFDKTPLSDPQRADLSALAGQIDILFIGIIDDLKSRSDENKWPPDSYSAADLFTAYLSIFANEYLKKQAGDPQQILVSAEARETITGSITGEVQPLQLELPFMPPITPDYHVIPNNSLANDLWNPNKPSRLNYGAYDLDVFGKKNNITSYIQVTYEPDPGSGITIRGQERLTAFERTVSNAIASLWEQAKKDGIDKPVISPAMIYRAMPGGGKKLPTGIKGAIVKAIKRFQILHIYVDATSEMQKRKVIGPKEKFELDSNFLLTTHAEYKAQNGQTVHAYRIEAEPLILTYSRAANQLLSIPAKYLNIPIKMNKDRQAIADYLLWRIAIMKYDLKNKKQNQSHIIRFDELFKAIGKEGQSDKQKKYDRDFCFDVLNYQATAGNIKGYKKLKEGREIAKIEILL